MSRDESERIADGGYPSERPAQHVGPSPIGAIRLFRAGFAGLRRNPSVLLAMALAGFAVAVVDWVRLADPVPAVQFAGVAGGQLTISYGVMVSVTAGTSTPLSALVDLRPQWLGWLAGLELLRNGALVLASVYGFATLLDAKLTVTTALRYAAVFGAFAALRTVAPSYSVGLLAGVVLIGLWLFVVARLAALPALLVGGASVSTAIGRSWRLTAGHGWSLVGIVALVGVASYTAASAPLAGPVLASVVAALQIAVVAAFVRLAGVHRAVTGR